MKATEGLWVVNDIGYFVTSNIWTLICRCKGLVKIISLNIPAVIYDNLSPFQSAGLVIHFLIFVTKDFKIYFRQISWQKMLAYLLQGYYGFLNGKL